MIKFYYHPSPNPAKVAFFLEESGLDYQMVPVDIRAGFDGTLDGRSVELLLRRCL